MVLFGSLKPVIAGLGIGLVLALALTRLLSGLVYGVSTTDPLTFVSLPVLLGVVAFLAGFFPAMRASRIDPLEALRVD
jgi:ABC-type antimicrobial peptide transport system permease subunit